MSPRDPDSDLGAIADYLSNHLSPDEAAALERELQANPERAELVEGLRRKWAYRPVGSQWTVDLEQAWVAVARQIGVSAVDGRELGKGSARVLPVGRWTRTPALSRPSTRTIWRTIAACVAAVVLVIAGWRGGERRVTTSLAARTSIYTTARGQRAAITLPDGSTVLLNVASQLQVPVDYAAGHRTLRLTGEAMFTVANREHTPFIVIAGPSTTRVLGTSFAVRYYATDSAATITVRDGKVAVRSSVVTGMQQLEVSRTRVSPVHSTSPAYFDFVAGVLTLEGVPIRDAITELNRWYDADIRLGDTSLARERISGGFNAGSLADLATNLEWTFNLRVERAGRTLTLYPRQ